MEKKYSSGFTLIEILLVMSIVGILIVSTLSIDFSSRKRITALVTDSKALSLLIYDMQNRAMSFLNDINAPTVGHNGYGVYFDLSSPNSVKTFYRTNSNTFNVVDVGSTFKNPTDKTIFSLGDRITKICLNDGGNANCNTNLNFSKLALFFVKPKQYANFYISNDSNDGSVFYSKTLNNAAGLEIYSACFEITTGQNETVESRAVVVTYIGQISELVGNCK